MTREELVDLAQRLASNDSLVGLRVVVIVTDHSGAFVGVGMNTPLADAQAMIRCAHEGDDLAFRNSTNQGIYGR